LTMCPHVRLTCCQFAAAALRVVALLPFLMLVVGGRWTARLELAARRYDPVAE